MFIVYNINFNINNINTNLFNGLFLIHPILNYIYYALIILQLYIYISKLFNNFYVNITINCSNDTYLYLLKLSICSIFLGSWWALQELTWGSWWNWDNIELVNLFLCVYTINTYHKNIIYKLILNLNKIKIIVLIIFILFYCIRYNILQSIHNFINLNNEYIYIYIYLLLYFVNYIIINVRFYYLYYFNVITDDINNNNYSIYIYILFILIESQFLLNNNYTHVYLSIQTFVFLIIYIRILYIIVFINNLNRLLNPITGLFNMYIYYFSCLVYLNNNSNFIKVHMSLILFLIFMLLSINNYNIILNFYIIDKSTYIILNFKLTFLSYLDVTIYSINLNSEGFNNFKINIWSNIDKLLEVNTQLNIINSYLYSWFEGSINSIIFIFKLNIFYLIIIIKYIIIIILYQ